MYGHTEGRTAERHVNIFLIFFFGGKIYTDSLVWPQGSRQLFVCFFFFFSFLLFVCSRSRGRLFQFFHFLFFFFFHFFQSVRGGRVRMNFLLIYF
ncbi:hypothetical protein TCDM_13109 [Trypanosoma cruzi Dm28c]|uniref:Uncharacterized protein n=1 Tax=Trypanosoma cruzi Dm28c TaxID=1416333 RepID=V5AP51_TRYCR|nr:hypothetical protein TCDM_13109 [Trypanosoma cruzi Dm28c]